MKTSKETRALTGLPGRVMIGVPSTTPAPCGIPGCIATFTKSTSSERESFTTSYAPALTPPVVMIRSASRACASSSARKTSTSSAVIEDVTTSAPASRTAAASMTALDS